MFSFLKRSRAIPSGARLERTRKTKLRIGWVVTPLSFQGGTWTHLKRWAEALDPERFHLTLFYHSPEDLTQEAEALDGLSSALLDRIQRIRLPELHFWAGGATPSGFWKAVTALEQALKTQAIDLIHTLFVGSDLVGMTAGTRLGLPVMSSVEGALLVSHLPHRTRLLLGGAWKVGSNTLAALTTVSEATARELHPWLGPTAPQPQVLRPGVPLLPLRPLPTGHPHLLTVGRLAPVKGLPVLIEALSRLVLELPHVRLTMVGAGPEQAPLEALIRSRRLTEHVRLTGWRSQEGVREALQQAHLLVQPSYHEGLPWTVLEAASMGVPCVATQVGGLEEAVIAAPHPQHTGWLVPPGSSSRLLSALRDAIGSPEALARLPAIGSRARDFIQAHHSQEKEGQTLGALYTHIRQPTR